MENHVVHELHLLQETLFNSKNTLHKVNNSYMLNLTWALLTV